MYRVKDYTVDADDIDSGCEEVPDVAPSFMKINNNVRSLLAADLSSLEMPLR